MIHLTFTTTVTVELVLIVFPLPYNCACESSAFATIKDGLLAYLHALLPLPTTEDLQLGKPFLKSVLLKNCIQVCKMKPSQIFKQNS